MKMYMLDSIKVDLSIAGNYYVLFVFTDGSKSFTERRVLDIHANELLAKEVVKRLNLKECHGESFGDCPNKATELSKNIEKSIKLITKNLEKSKPELFL